MNHLQLMTGGVMGVETEGQHLSKTTAIHNNDREMEVKRVF